MFFLGPTSHFKIIEGTVKGLGVVGRRNHMEDASSQTEKETHMITTEDILAKTFTETRFGKGYDQGEVDEFLDTLAAQLKPVAIPVVIPPVPTEAPVVGAAPTVQSIALLLDNAQKAADQISAEATQQAAVTVYAAQQQAKALVDAATVKAAQIAAEASAQHDAVAASVEALKAQHKDIAARLKDALSKLAGDVEESAA